MNTGYQRGLIQGESLRHEQRKHDGSLPVVGVNTFLRDDADGHTGGTVELARATEEEKRSQVQRVRAFQQAPAAGAEDELARHHDGPHAA